MSWISEVAGNLLNNFKKCSQHVITYYLTEREQIFVRELLSKS